MHIAFTQSAVRIKYGGRFEVVDFLVLFCFAWKNRVPSDDGGLRKIPLVNPLFDLDYFKVGW